MLDEVQHPQPAPHSCFSEDRLPASVTATISVREVFGMVDFRKRIGNKSAAKVVDPVKLYASLDRASDKGPLRPVQERVLSEWHATRREDRDVILKLHTGQGKTLLGLLMLQSKLNQGVGPALYLCPNHFLVNQTVEQARQFGISCVTAADELPDEFAEGRAILVTVVHKLFNGLTKFKLGAQSLPVGLVLVDDAHACIDAIKDQFIITLRRNQPSEANAYSEILELFENELRSQGDGSFEDIRRNDYHAYLPVPYWAWWDKSSEVARILSRHANTDAIKFSWPLLKDSLRHTLCLVSGTQVVIAPHLPPLYQFGSYENAKHRVFMSATVTDDSFLVKGLGLNPKAVQNPLVDPEETWSGEKMVLIPSLIDDQLSRTAIVEAFAKENTARQFGIVVLVPSAQRCADWGKYGAHLVDKNSIAQAVEDLHNRSYSKAIVIANYYDGIDLPDNTCRVLIIDSKPFAEELMDRYLEERRQGSNLIAGRIARIVEQGMGRAVRGEKDYCVVVLVGSDLVRALQAPGQRDFFSDQTRMQIQIGKDIAEFAKEEIEAGKDSMVAFNGLVRQCLQRDAGWKDWYVEQMDAMEPRGQSTRDDLLRIFQAEVSAERAFQDGNYDGAAKTIQNLLDKFTLPDSDRGWYLQEIARYTFPSSKTQSNEFQRNAHKTNRSLLRPKEGMLFSKVPTLTPEKRVARIKEWLASHELFENVATQLDAILTNLSFGVIADRFEQALQDLAGALGFESDRPDKEWKEGPDNLWGLREDQYLLFECKSEVELTRTEINKRETDQMNRSSAWFKRYYPGSTVSRVLIIPARRLASSAALNDEVLIMSKKQLDQLTRNVHGFFNEFRKVDLRDLSERKIEEYLYTHKLTVDDLTGAHGQKPIAHKAP
jgi:replicative superfamily II helicase